VCVVGPEGDLEDLSCKHPAWGSPDTVTGIGTVFSLAEGPILRTGTWRLLTESLGLDEGTKPEPLAVSAPFSVSPCGEDCDKSIASDIVTEFKAAAFNNYAVYYASCAAMALIDGYKELNSQFNKALTGELLLDEAKKKIKEAAQRWDFANGVMTAYASVTSITGVIFQSPQETIRTGEKKAIEILKKLTCTLGATFLDISNDPPDPRVRAGPAASRSPSS